MGRGGAGAGGGAQPAPGRVSPGGREGETERVLRVGWGFAGMFLEPKVNFRPAERLWAAPCCSLSSAASYINHLNKRFLAVRASVSGDVYSLPRHSARLKSFQRVTVPHRSDQEHPSEQLLSLGAAFWQIR